MTHEKDDDNKKMASNALLGLITFGAILISGIIIWANTNKAVKELEGKTLIDPSSKTELTKRLETARNWSWLPILIPIALALYSLLTMNSSSSAPYQKQIGYDGHGKVRRARAVHDPCDY